jgi:biopolymer transport protein ExbD
MKKRMFAESPEENIDISPLMDVVFILLIFFMVTTTFNKDLELGIERPEARSATVVTEETVRVTVTGDGRVGLDGHEMPLWSLSMSVQKTLATRTRKSVIVVADKSVQADLLVQIVDACRLAGARQVGVATSSSGGTQVQGAL